MASSSTIFTTAPGWAGELDRAVIDFLAHTGSLSCVSKASELTCLARNAGRLCCPTQQFYHPFDAELQPEDQSGHTSSVNPRLKLYTGDEEEADDDSSSWYGIPAREFEEKRVRRDWTWSCCGESFYCTGCFAAADGTDDADAQDAINANERAAEAAYECNTAEDDDCSYAPRDWDDSIYGDAKRGCTCGYTDGLDSYCAC